jgi:hypothetical protein
VTDLMYDYYILEFHPDHPRAEGEGWVPQQILVMEAHLGRELSPDEEVRHLNGDPHDNRAENLRIVTPQFGSKTNALFDSQDSARRLSKTFVPCKYQKPCWKEVRAPIARSKKVFLPYICSFQSEGDIYKCSHFWKFKSNEIKGDSSVDSLPTTGIE